MTLFYSILFGVLMLIDWSQSSLNGGIWAMTVNCIGLILCILMGSLLSWEKRPGKIYIIWAGIWLAGSVIAYGVWKIDINHVLDGQFITALLNIGAIGVLAIKYWQDGIFQKFFREEKRKNVLLVGLWIALTLWMCLSPQRSVWHIWFFVLFSLFYILPLTNIQKSRIVNGVLNGIVLGFFILQILAYGFRPYDEVRYRGFFFNCNHNALMYLVTYGAVLTRILFWEKSEKSASKRWWLCFFYVLAGGLLGFQLMTMTRTALIVAALLTVCFLGVLLYRCFLEKRLFFKSVRYVVARGIVIVGLTFLLFPIVFATVRYLPTILHHPIWFGNEYSVKKVHSFDDYDSDKYIEIDEFLEEFCERFSITIPYKVHAQEISAEKQAEETERGSEWSRLVNEGSGALRLAIYRKYMDNFNWTGHTTQDAYMEIRPGYYTYHGHNVFIQTAFIYGVPAVILFVVLIAVIGIRLLLAFLKRPYDPWTIFRGFAYLFFLGYGMLECSWNTGQLTLLLFYFTQKSLETDEALVRKPKKNIITIKEK